MHAVHVCCCDFSLTHVSRQCTCLDQFPTLQRMRELNVDGSVKDVACLMAELGFVVGGFAERKADKTKGKIVTMSDSEVKVEIIGAPGVSANVPLKLFLDAQWVSYTPKPQRPEVVVSPKSVLTDDFQAVRHGAMILQKMCELAILNDKAAQRLKVQFQPGKQVVSEVAFEKGKLILVPLCSKVVHSFQIDRSDNKVTAQVVNSKATFTLVPMGNAPKDDGTVAPFWFMSSSSDDFNMELTHQKDGDFRLPVARNVKPIKPGDQLIVFKPKKVVEPLKTDAQAVTPEPPPKKKRKSN